MLSNTKIVTSTIAIVIMMLVLAYLAPGAIGTLQSAEQNTQINAFVAENNDSTPEELQLSRFPVIANSETVTVNATPIASSTYDVVHATGVVTLDDNASDEGDDIVVSYTYIRNLTAFWPVLVILSIVALLLLVWRVVQRQTN